MSQDLKWFTKGDVLKICCKLNKIYDEDYTGVCIDAYTVEWRAQMQWNIDIERLYF